MERHGEEETEANERHSADHAEESAETSVERVPVADNIVEGDWHKMGDSPKQMLDDIIENGQGAAEGLADNGAADNGGDNNGGDKPDVPQGDAIDGTAQETDDDVGDGNHGTEANSEAVAAAPAEAAAAQPAPRPFKIPKWVLVLILITVFATLVSFGIKMYFTLYASDIQKNHPGLFKSKWLRFILTLHGVSIPES